MTKRLIPFFSFFVLFCLCVGVAYAAGEVFTISSVTYTDKNGKQQTVPFDAMSNKATIPGVSVNNDIIINGTYGPPGTGVTGNVKVETTAEAAPKLDGQTSWTHTIPKNKLASNKTHLVWVNNGSGTVDIVIINAKNIKVQDRTIIIQAP